MQHTDAWLVLALLAVLALATILLGQAPPNPLLNPSISREGGLMNLFKACEPLSRGHVVEASAAAYLGVYRCPSSSQACFGVVYSDASGSVSVASGAWCWVVHAGVAEVLCDAAGAVGTLITTSASTTRGLAQVQTVVPPVTVAEHNGEIGRLVTPSPGPGRLASAVLHWN